jgi:methylated-DNA-[protein]-cysteine S-methyltransferase
MPTSGLAFFDSAIGVLGIAWSERGIAGLRLPERDAQETRRHMLRRFPALVEAEPPHDVQAAIEGIQALLRGEPRDLAEIALDLDGIGDFQRGVYAIARRIPPGRTRSYGDIATELGDRLLARAVGQALGANPFAPVVPCHRVLAAGGKWGGFSAHGGAEAKLRMLATEGARPESESGDLF